MKKPYSKPELVYECFELSQSIAANCTYISHMNRDLCSVPINEGVSIFVSKTCSTRPAPGDSSICYDIPNGEVNVFSS